MTATARIWLGGFLLLGVLVGCPGALLVAWQYQTDVEPQLIGLHFLALNAGFVIAAAVAPKLLGRISIRVLAQTACVVACAGLSMLDIASPPAPFAWRLIVFGAIGIAAGGLGTALLYGFGAGCKAPLKNAALLFGGGCLFATITIGGTYIAGTGQIKAALLATVPFVFLLLFGRLKVQTGGSNGVRRNREQDGEELQDLHSIATVLFSLLVFFQFGNEWALAGWLPLFLIHRLGSNPSLAIGVLALYFLTLTLGRVVGATLLARFNRRRLLIGSLAIAMCGLAWLSYTDSLTGATVATVITGAGLAPIYPIITERLDGRFPYRPGFYNGAVSIAMTGAMATPWLMGFLDKWLGMDYVMLLPLAGCILVLIMSLLLMFEAHLMSDKAAERQSMAESTRG